jgi:cytoskeletal protein CcmA (bactofilin family)
MAIWKDNNQSRQSPAPAANAPDSIRMDSPSKPEIVSSPTTRFESDRARSESLIAADIMIEGRIEGSGSVRIAGKFKGDVNVQGDLTIEAGAKLTGSVRADKVVVAGELEGNIEAASLVNLLPSGVIAGDVKAGALTVAAGARMRGQVEFGWDDNKVAAKPPKGFSNGAEISSIA